MQIIEGLPEQFRVQAAQLYWEAFSDKLGKILGPDTRGTAYFADILVPEKAIAALSDDGETLLGLAGFDLGDGGVIGGGYKEIARHYGYFGGLWRGIVMEMFTRKVTPETLQMDGITASADARGQGVGTALLEAIFEKAKTSGLKYVMLDVIDTNPRAKSLYERKGFSLLKTEHIGPLKWLFGFEKAYKMRKVV